LTEGRIPEKLTTDSRVQSLVQQSAAIEAIIPRIHCKIANRLLSLGKYSLKILHMSGISPPLRIPDAIPVAAETE
jgi:hypothetical protein